MFNVLWLMFFIQWNVNYYQIGTILYNASVITVMWKSENGLFVTVAYKLQNNNNMVFYSNFMITCLHVILWNHIIRILYFYFVYVIMFIQTTITLSFVFTRSDCHLTLITLIYWIKNDHVLLKMIMIDSWGTVHSAALTCSLVQCYAGRQPCPRPLSPAVSSEPSLP